MRRRAGSVGSHGRVRRDLHRGDGRQCDAANLFWSGDNLLVNARGKLFVNCATISPDVHVEVEKLANKAGAQSLEACMASSITQAREGTLYLMCGGNRRRVRKAEPILKELAAQMRYVGKAGEAAKVKALVNMVMNINTAGLAEGLGARRRARSRPNDVARSLFADRRQLARARDRRRRHAEPRAHLLFLRRARRQGQRHRARTRAQSRTQSAARRATKEQYDRMIAEGLGDLDKSGIAELTFKDRHKHSGDRV